MSTIPSKEKSKHPFIDLLSQAKEFVVEEIPTTRRQSSLADVLFDKTSKKASPIPQRSFIVRVPANLSSAPATTSSPSPKVKPPANQSDIYLLNSATLLLENKDYLLARNIFSHLLKRDLRNGEALKGLGRCLLQLGEIHAAKKCFGASWQFGNRHGALVWLGKCLSHEGKDKEAIIEFGRAQHGTSLSKKETYELYKELGNCFTRQSQFESAIRSYTKALAIQPESDTIYVNLGTLEFQRKRYDIAKKYFSKALTVDPNNERAYCGLGLLGCKQGAREEAEHFFFKALDRNPKNLLAIHQLVNLAHESKEYTPIKNRLTAFLEKTPGHIEIRYAISGILFHQSRWVECERELDRILEIKPSHEKAIKLKQELFQNKHLKEVA